ncbi:MAG: shikimate dehydrogenase [Desulfocucumaceae bacterium]
MGRFAFVVHPQETGDVANYLPPARYLPDWAVEGLCRLVPPIKVLEVANLGSALGKASGWIIAVPLTSRQIEVMPDRLIVSRLVRAGRMAERLGAEILGLGGLTAMFGYSGSTVCSTLKVAVNTGDSYALMTALEGAMEAAILMGHRPDKIHAVVSGASGPAGSLAAWLLSQKVRYLTLVDREMKKLEELAGKILYYSGLSVKISTAADMPLGSAQMFIATPQSDHSIRRLLPGTIVCNLTKSVGLSRKITAERDDILVMEGAEVVVPGYSRGSICASLAETILLAMEKGRKSSNFDCKNGPEKAKIIMGLAVRHGFKRAGIKCCGGIISPDNIENIKVNAIKKGFSPIARHKMP